MCPVDIKDLTFEELKSWLESCGEPKYRASQIFDWVYKKGATSFSDFTDLPKGLRQRLADHFSFRSLELGERLKSQDGTEKLLFKLADGQFIEAVLISSGERKTLCLSTQVGCKFACAFCASGMGGLTRNMLPSEISGQVLFLRDRLNLSLTNFVFMGMGEPLDNVDNVIKAIRIMNAPEGLGIAARRITVSTAGIIPGIEHLKTLGLQVKLSLSLHAVRDDLRSRLLPVNKKYPLAKLLSVCADYVERTGRLVTLEYILIGGINDSVAEARRLASIAKRLKAKVNLIPYSPIPGLDFVPSPQSRQGLFLRTLDGLKVKATLRRSKGEDIQAACGQLAGHIKADRFRT
jgi:23S rRNA (adenine2503-C2)-methyltransferase